MRAVRLAAVPLGLIASLAIAASASADSVAVTTTTDVGAGGACELRDAITAVSTDATQNGCEPDLASGADTITFDPALTGQTIDLSMGELFVDDPDPLSISGPGMNDLQVSAGGSSRAFHVADGSSLSIWGMTIRDGAPSGAASDRGGCLYGEGTESTLNLTDVRVTQCDIVLSLVASFDLFAEGAGIGSDGTLTLDHSLVDQNIASASSVGGPTDTTGAYARGGAIYSGPEGSLTITDSTISDNIAAASDTGGGEVAATAGIHSFGQAQMYGSTVSGNSASAVAHGTNLAPSRAAGGLAALDVTSIERSTFADNIADAVGSGVRIPAAGIYAPSHDLFLQSSTIAFNGPTLGSENGVNLFVDGGGVTVSNSILADPRGGGDNCVNTGTMTSEGFNDDFSPAGASCGFGEATDLSADPLLADTVVGDLGGPTPTIGLQPTSPVIDAGFTDANTDQRTFTRPVDFTGVPNATGGNGTDIGAFEFQSTCTGQALPDGPCPGGGGGGGGNPPAPPPPASTGKRHKALKKCRKINPKKAKTKKAKKKKAKKRKKCIKRAKKLPV
jgi:hypothetical protein